MGAGQLAQELGLCLGEAHGALAAEQLAAAWIEGAVAEAERPPRGGHGPAQDGLDAQQQLLRLEGLGQIVVGAELEALDAVVGQAAGGEDQHRRAARRAGAGAQPAREG